MYKVAKIDDSQVFLGNEYCPDTDIIEVQGNYLLTEGTQHLTSGFVYVINSCQSMNLIYEELGEPKVECMPYEDILNALPNISVGIKTIH